jgi:hypothetical protein
MTFIESFEDQLVQAAREQRDARFRYRAARFAGRVLPRGRRGPAVVLAALLIGVPAATATVRGWDPFDDSSGRNPHIPAPSAGPRSAAAELVATLGVLRREQTDADRGVDAEEASRAFSASAGYRGAQLKSIRLLDAQRGIVLIPFERGAVPLDAQGRPSRAFPPETYMNVACLFEHSADGFAGIGCHTAQKIKIGRAISSGSNRVTGLVPDGVARVRLIRGDATSEASVQDNLFVAEGAEPPLQVDWLREDGSLIRQIDLTAPPPRFRAPSPVAPETP